MKPQCPSCPFRVQCLISPKDMCVATAVGTMGFIRAVLKFHLTQPVPISRLVHVLQQHLSFWGRPFMEYRKIYHYIITLAHQGTISISKDSQGNSIVGPA